jgi:hypothetical protein
MRSFEFADEQTYCSGGGRTNENFGVCFRSAFSSILYADVPRSHVPRRARF